MRRASAYLALLAAFGMPQAQQRPDAGTTLREQQLPAPAPAKPTPPMPRIEAPERPALSAPAAARFQVKAFRITGATAFPTARLEQLVRDLAGRELGLDELQEAAARITRFYRENGYPVARAYLPAQDVREGVVEIAVLEGRYGRVELDNRSRVKDGVVQRYLTPLRPGTVIEGKPLERSLLLLSDLPGVAMPDAALRPGANTGESDLVLSLAAAPLASGSAEVDNYGNRYTGAWRTSGNFALASPTGYGDLVSARVTAAGPGLSSGRLGYQLPLGGDGLRLGAAYADTEYRLGKDFAVLDASGYARVATLSASYPFLRSLGLNVAGQLAFDAKRLEDRNGAIGAVAPKRNDGVTAGLSGNWLDSAGKGANSFSLAAVSGKLRLDSVAAQLADDTGPRASGSFSKLGYAISRLQQLGGSLSGFVSVSGQQAGKNLDSSEKFLLGGPYGVRAYPQGEAAGDEGYVFTGELRYRVPQVQAASMELFALFDYGESRINHSAFASGTNRRTLSGVGVGLNLASSSSWLLRAAWSWATGHEVATSDTPRSGRGWLQLAKFF
jgi:hemolysin activation/secretion protein